MANDPNTIQYVIQEDGFWYIASKDRTPGVPEITVSSKGVANGLSTEYNDGFDFGPDSYDPTSTANPPYTQTSGIQELFSYGLKNNISVKFASGTYLIDQAVTVNYSVNAIFDFDVYGSVDVTIQASSSFPSGDNMLSFIKSSPYSFDVHIYNGLNVLGNSNVNACVYTENLTIFQSYEVNCNTAKYGRYHNNSTTLEYHAGNGACSVYGYYATNGNYQMLYYPENFGNGTSGNASTGDIYLSCGSSVGSWIIGGFSQSSYGVAITIGNGGIIGFIVASNGNAIQFVPYSSGGTVFTTVSNIFIHNMSGNAITIGGATYGQITNVNIYQNTTNITLVDNSSSYALGLTVENVYVNGTLEALINGSSNGLKLKNITPTPVPTLSTNPPVSGTVYQNTNPYDIEIDLPVYATTSGTAGYVTIAKGSTDSPTSIGNQYVSGDTSDTSEQIIRLRVPTGWYYEFTASGVTFGTASVFAD